MLARALLTLILGLLPAASAAGQPHSALYAVVIGVNRSADRAQAPLRYADDDAARYFELFRQLGAQTYLLSRLDANTRRVHAQAAAEALVPTVKNLADTVSRLRTSIQEARKRGVRTRVYLVYAGHGKLVNRQGVISMEDGFLTGSYISRKILGPLGAHEAHMVVDACNSYHLAFSRGPGGQRRHVQGFSRIGLVARKDLGLLLSTSSARDSHEWEAYQAGVFSHVVRSGLRGAADADADGQVSYREMAAFVKRASAAIPNERFRPRVFARPPLASGVFMDLRKGGRRLMVPRALHGRYLLEDRRGVRVADFHSSPNQQVALLLPPATPTYLLRLPDRREFAISPGAGDVSLSALKVRPSRVARRGAAHHAFSLMFTRPFDREVVARYHDTAGGMDMATEAWLPGNRTTWRKKAGWIAAGLSVAALTAGVACTLSAQYYRNQARSGDSHAAIVERNDDLRSRNTAAATLYSVGGAAALGSLLLLLLPEGAPPVHTGMTLTGRVWVGSLF